MNSLSTQYSAFVIGPIGDKDAPVGSLERGTYEDAIQVFEDVILPACDGFSIKALRADKISRPGEITDQIFRLLRDSDLVIADLTGANPNVMYELGLRHTTGKLTIQMGERGRLPFDISAIRTILFKRSEAGLIEARRRLAEALATGIQEGSDLVSASRIWMETSEQSTISTQAELLGIAEDDSDGEELGFLEKLSNMEDGIEKLSSCMEVVSAATIEIGEQTNLATDEINKLNAANSRQSAKLLATERLAAKLQDPTSKMEEAVAEYGRLLDQVDPGMVYLLNSVRGAEEGQEEFVSTISQMIDNAEETILSLEGLRDASITVGQVTRSMRHVNQRIAKALGTFISKTNVILLWRKHIYEPQHGLSEASVVPDK